ncbi:HAD-IIA family hydrolase [Kutzneria kofuensis]|uniref:HAD superfamily hydrolase (TIGR01450 family) n=1 Tax=Kutzneria kofuensis TaxID=103725 RepID=A0A7W9KLS8_9PSEU|nr:HAD-IIA family hydrolase [Kutzneria kofuensis]MBB5894915.1 HAD superfamily hydrolase (TIGR01450 family) [Kutzneria kofuensis]
MTEPDLLAAYDALLLDLDGTVYRGGEAVPGAVEAIKASRDRGVGIRYVTNNASRKPASVAAHLNELGFQAADEEVSTSSQAGAAVLAERLDQGALVLILGTQALADEVTAVGLTTTREFTPEVAAVVQGHSPDTGWRELCEAALAIRNGALWVACNVDATLPTERGLMPGNGSMVAALRAATDVEPVVAGKPARPLMDQAIRSAGARKPLVVGDRLDTDIAGASAAELDALLVLTGVATPAQVLEAPAGLRPRYVSADLSGLLVPVSEVEIGKQPDWDVQVDGDTLTVSGSGDALALLRGLCAAWWQAGGGPVTVHAGDEASMTALAELNIG